MTQAERITALEVKVAENNEAIGKLTDKIEDLLALRNKGMGVFWLFSTIFGSGIIGLVITIVQWIKGY